MNHETNITVRIVAVCAFVAWVMYLVAVYP
jgi:hypothetical protein